MSNINRKILRNLVRCYAKENGLKPSKAVHNWRHIISEAVKRIGGNKNAKS